ncbi:hypothetical protein M0R45_020082 [Rubus argutus]|uniref:Uncharacterized protein n=1 Tax=Rubus argutus TaxID=59490 RepID=A0AAW1X8Z2_RUBAR
MVAGGPAAYVVDDFSFSNVSRVFTTWAIGYGSSYALQYLQRFGIYPTGASESLDMLINTVVSHALCALYHSGFFDISTGGDLSGVPFDLYGAVLFGDIFSGLSFIGIRVVFLSCLGAIRDQIFVYRIGVGGHDNHTLDRRLPFVSRAVFPGGPAAYVVDDFSFSNISRVFTIWAIGSGSSYALQYLQRFGIYPIGASESLDMLINTAVSHVLCALYHSGFFDISTGGDLSGLSFIGIRAVFLSCLGAIRDQIFVYRIGVGGHDNHTLDRRLPFVSQAAFPVNNAYIPMFLVRGFSGHAC